jgi:hypothetical protein
LSQGRMPGRECAAGATGKGIRVIGGASTPDRRYMRLFTEIVRRVWSQRQESSDAVLNSVIRRLRELKDRKNTLVDFLLRRLDQQPYEEQVLRT